MSCAVPADNAQFYDQSAYSVPWSSDPDGWDWDIKAVNSGAQIPDDLPLIEFFAEPSAWVAGTLYLERLGVRHLQVFDESALTFIDGCLDMEASSLRARELPAYALIRDYLPGEPRWAG
jgi:hypothetical protein